MSSRPSLRRACCGLGVLAAVALLAGCPGTLDDPSRFAGEFATGGAGGGSAADCTDVPTFLATTCGTTGCHSATAPQQNLDLVSPNVLARLSGVKAMESSGLLVDPTDPSASVLYLKMKSPPPFGSLMPLGGAPVSSAQLACVLAWIGPG